MSVSFPVLRSLDDVFPLGCRSSESLGRWSLSHYACSIRCCQFDIRTANRSDRWSLLIVRELLFGPLRFTEMEQGLPGISRSVLADRLKRLQGAGICTKTTNGAYRFTEAGEALRPVVQSMGEWVARWILTDPAPAEADPRLLVPFISRGINRDALPDQRVVTEFRFSDQQEPIWLTLERHDVSVCLEDPCLPIDLVVEGDVSDLYRVYIGRATLEGEREAGRIQLRGRPSMVRAFPNWMDWSTFTEESRQATSQAR